MPSEGMTMKNVLVTGANKGIGRAVCERLLKEYPDVCVFLGSRDLGRGEQAAKEIRASLGESVCKGRLEVVAIDVTSDESVKAASANLADTPLYGIVNNAALGFGHTLQQILNTNFWGPRRVNEAFGKCLVKPGGRIVNVASAAGPMFIESKKENKELQNKLGDPISNIPGGIEAVDGIAKSTTSISFAYGFSKALLNAYTIFHAKAEPDLIINSCTPGFIATDLTKSMGATKLPSAGAVPVVWTLMSPDLERVPSGRYYGSDCVRSPIDRYRDPGDPPYEGP